MTRLTGRAISLAVAASLLALSAWAGQAPEELNDSVHLEDNSATNVRIVEDDWKGVKIQPRVGKNVDLMAFAVNRVNSTEYGNRAAEYDKGMDELRKGNHKDAIRLLNVGLRKTSDAKQKQYFYAGLVECYEASGDANAMRGAIRKLVPRDPKNAPRLIYDAYLKLGNSYLREGNFAKAEESYKAAYEFFKNLEGISRQQKTLSGVLDYIKAFRLKAKYWMIYSMERQGVSKIKDRSGARRAYDLFAFEATGKPGLVNLAKIGRARCDAILGKVEQARKALGKLQEELGKTKDGMKVLPAVYVALGDVAFAEGDYRKARWYYLSVIVKHSGNRDMVARSHFMAGQCYEKLREKVREREALPRALRHYTIVAREFQDSLEHAAARKRMEAIKARMGA